jgi:hypothetical protein
MKNHLLDGEAEDPWACSGVPIPEVYSSRLAFLKVVALGVGITVALFGVLSLLLMHS